MARGGILFHVGLHLWPVIALAHDPDHTVARRVAKMIMESDHQRMSKFLGNVYGSILLALAIQDAIVHVEGSSIGDWPAAIGAGDWAVGFAGNPKGAPHLLVGNRVRGHTALS